MHAIKLREDWFRPRMRRRLQGFGPGRGSRAHLLFGSSKELMNAGD
jgi:hypothetical protein